MTTCSNCQKLMSCVTSESSTVFAHDNIDVDYCKCHCVIENESIIQFFVEEKNAGEVNDDKNSVCMRQTESVEQSSNSNPNIPDKIIEPPYESDENFLTNANETTVSNTPNNNIDSITIENNDTSTTVSADPWLNETVRLKDGTAGKVFKCELGWYYIKSESTDAISKSRSYRLVKFDGSSNTNIDFVQNSALNNDNDVKLTSNHEKKSSIKKKISSSTNKVTADVTITTFGRKRKQQDTSIGSKKVRIDTVASSNNASTLDSKTTNTNNNDILCQPINNPAIIAPSVLLSLRDKSRGLILSHDQLSCYGTDGGYKLIRATHGVHSGAYYFEVQILSNGKATSRTNSSSNRNSNRTINLSEYEPQFRIGWASRQAELEGPLGYDKFSFAYRSKSGSKVHQSLREDFYGESYAPGDVIGCYIRLDNNDFVNNNEIRFFKNGVDQGVAFKGVTRALYFPAISIYMGGAVSVNFGPSFIYRHDIYGANPISEVQPMNPTDRKQHEVRIANIRHSLLIATKTKIKEENN